jgi:spore germination protein GerM
VKAPLIVRHAGAIAMLSSLVVVSACGLSPDSSPRAIPDAQQQDLIDLPSGASETTGTGRIYLERTDETGRSLLSAVARELGSEPISVLRSLFSGPTDDEQELGLRSAIPRDTKALSARFVANDFVRVDVSSDIFGATGDDLVSAVAQIVLSLTEIDGVERILISVEGRSQEWPRGDGSLTAEPLTEFDYPGRAASSQPPYPGIVIGPANS